MMGNECRRVRREIDESELNEMLSNSAVSHLASCQACSTFRHERAGLRELVGGLEAVSAPPDFDMRLRARIAAQRQTNGRRPSLFNFVVSTPAIAVAALIVLGIATAVWLAQPNTNQEVARNAATSPTRAVESPRPSESPVQNTVTPQADEEDVQIPNRRRNNPRGGLMAKGPSFEAIDSDVREAKGISRGPFNAGEVNLTAPGKPLVVSMEDDRGMTHKFSMPPVSFGAQRFVDNRTFVSAPNTRSW